MVRKTANQLYWDAKKMAQINSEYQEFLTQESRENTSESAQLFASKVIGTGFDYLGFKERDLILKLAGKLPYMYD